ncbi:hypothetical protein MY04_1922 [Flammeovirga sp. MY04]|uniref:hypothetical protein n=1 Tax=Flammeovirga sp. MY04 TaxID=1191459 RepID=UPI000806201E|nr:hypothetical protein [Flammeovirga sp. MY04]ANQ49296.1 hypothetical protein MY04_1922 [Flammeovirga sp. MY04]
MRITQMLFICLLSLSISKASTITWLGTKSTDWNDADNWSPSSIPTSSDDVVIDNSATDTLIIDETVTIADFYITNQNELKIISGGTLNCSNFYMDHRYGEFIIEDGNLNVTNHFTGTGEYESEGYFTMSSGNVNIGGNFYWSIRPGRQHVTITGGTITIGGSIKCNSGSWTISGGEFIMTASYQDRVSIGISKLTSYLDVWFYDLTINTDSATDSVIIQSDSCRDLRVQRYLNINQGIFAPNVKRDIQIDSTTTLNSGNFIPNIGTTNETLFIDGLIMNGGTVDFSNITGTSDIYIQGALKMNSGIINMMEEINSNYFEIYDDADFSGGSVTGSNFSLYVEGSSNSEIKLTTGGNKFDNVYVYNNVTVTLQDDLTVTGSIGFQYGHFEAANSSIGIILEDNATIIDNGTYYPEDIAHANCKVTKKGNDAFVFPVGDGTYYRPITMSAPAVTTDQFTASYYYASPNAAGYDSTALAGSLSKHINANEYWILDRDAGSSNVTVTLSWNSRTSNTPEADNLKVVRWDGIKWDDHEGTPSGSASSGEIVSNLITSFSPFTIHYEGSMDLPVELIHFNAELVEDGVFIKWATATEINNDEFVIEKSNDKTTWDEVGRIRGSGNSNVRNDYHILDAWNPAFGEFYYRLVQIDFDGTKTYYDPVLVKNNDKNHIISTYPNPIKNGDYLNINLNSYDHYKVRVFNSHGQLIDEFDAEHSHHYLVEGHHGIIFVEVILPDKRFTERILIRD